MVMGRRYWERLPEDIRSILLEEGQSWGDALTGLTVSAEQSQRDFLESQGAQIAEDIDFASLREATRSVYSANPDWSPGLYEKIQRILKQ